MIPMNREQVVTGFKLFTQPEPLGPSPAPVDGSALWEIEEIEGFKFASWKPAPGVRYDVVKERCGYVP